jgi:hypothetical protein
MQQTLFADANAIVVSQSICVRAVRRAQVKISLGLSARRAAPKESRVMSRNMSRRGLPLRIFWLSSKLKTLAARDLVSGPSGRGRKHRRAKRHRKTVPIFNLSTAPQLRRFKWKIRSRMDSLSRDPRAALALFGRRSTEQFAWCGRGMGIDCAPHSPFSLTIQFGRVQSEQLGVGANIARMVVSPISCQRSHPAHAPSVIPGAVMWLAP